MRSSGPAHGSPGLVKPYGPAEVDSCRNNFLLRRCASPQARPGRLRTCARPSRARAACRLTRACGESRPAVLVTLRAAGPQASSTAASAHAQPSPSLSPPPEHASGCGPTPRRRVVTRGDSPGSPGELPRALARFHAERAAAVPARQPFPRGTRLRRRARRRESARRAGPATAAGADAPPSARAPDRRRARRVDARARSSGDATRPRCALLEEERQVAAPETACYARARKGGSLSERTAWLFRSHQFKKHFSTESINFLPRRYHDACTQYLIGLQIGGSPITAFQVD